MITIALYSILRFLAGFIFYWYREWCVSVCSSSLVLCVTHNVVKLILEKWPPFRARFEWHLLSLLGTDGKRSLSHCSRV